MIIIIIERKKKRGKVLIPQAAFFQKSLHQSRKQKGVGWGAWLGVMIHQSQLDSFITWQVNKTD